jgi:DNA-binding IclR family transcriptional regulator
VSSVQSVERALALLREIGRRPGGLVDLSARVDLATSTAARLLATLESEDAVTRDTDGVYTIGAAIQAMAGSTDATRTLETIVHPHLVDLAADLDEAMCLAMLSGYDTVTVDQVDAPKPVQAENWTGTRVPLHAGGAGLVVMATWTDDEVEQYLSGELLACNENTVTDPDRLRSRVRQARMRRVMWTHGEYVEGLSSASAAIIDAAGRAVGALYTYGPSYRFPATGEADRVAARVLACADEISAELGFRRLEAAVS